MSGGRRRQVWILGGVGVAALSIVAVFTVVYWDVALALWRARQLDGAATPAEAAPLLDQLWAESLRPRARQAVVDALGPARSKLTLWTLTRLEAAGESPPALATLIGKRLERDEELLGMWCHFLRWRQGAGFVHCLDAWSPAESEAASGMLCGTMVDRSTLRLYVIQGSATGVRLYPTPHGIAGQLQALALAWFAGMAPLPGLDEDPQQKLKDWLTAYAPFRHETAFDSALGRCKRAEAMPSTTPFAERAFQVPVVPFAGWEGPVPALPDYPDTSYRGVLIDSNWQSEPLEIKESEPVRRAR